MLITVARAHSARREDVSRTVLSPPTTSATSFTAWASTTRRLSPSRALTRSVCVGRFLSSLFPIPHS